MVETTNIPRDHFRRRHDNLKITLKDKCKLSGVVIEMEVYNVFSKLIPFEGFARYESNRQRQAIIPDLCLVFPVCGQPKSVLQEIKFISISQTRYKPCL